MAQIKFNNNCVLKNTELSYNLNVRWVAILISSSVSLCFIYLIKTVFGILMPHFSKMFIFAMNVKLTIDICSALSVLSPRLKPCKNTKQLR